MNNIYVSYLNRIKKHTQIEEKKYTGNKWIPVGKPLNSDGSGYYEFKIDAGDNAVKTYAVQSNLAISPAGNLGFLFTQYESTGKIALTFMGSESGRL